MTWGKKLIDDYIKGGQLQNSGKPGHSLDNRPCRSEGAPFLHRWLPTAKAANELMDEEKYETVSDARAGAKKLPETHRGINQIDLIHFAENIGTAESKPWPKH